MWYWNPKAARYQWRNGRARFLKRKTVLGYVQETIDATGKVTDTLAELVSNGMLSPADWREMMRQQIKSEHIRQAVLAAGGRENMTPRRWGLVGAAIKDQYAYLDKMTDLIAEQTLSEGQIAARSRMYLNAAREAFERVNMDVHLEAGFDEVLWVIDRGAENCPDCEQLAALGWQKIEGDPFNGCWPGSGCTVCLTNCRCHLEYRKREDA